MYLPKSGKVVQREIKYKKEPSSCILLYIYKLNRLLVNYVKIVKQIFARGETGGDACTPSFSVSRHECDLKVKFNDRE